MEEYISREYLLKEIKAFLEKDKWKKYRTLRERRERKRYTQIFEIGVKHFPAADVRPVIYAHWTTDHPDKRNKEWHCSNCKFEPQVFENTNFCPNCGAVMNGGSNG